MSTIITAAAEVPRAYAYVLANDSFMSGWGHAEGKINTCIFPVTSSGQLALVLRNTEARSEMKYIRVAYSRPRLRASVLYSLFDESATSFYGGPNEGGAAYDH